MLVCKSSPHVVAFGMILSAVFVLGVEASAYDYQAGWPLELDEEVVDYPLQVADLDGDGSNEVLFVTVHPLQGDDEIWKIWLVTADGTTAAGFPRSFWNKRVSQPAVANLDQAPDLEIITALSWDDDSSPTGTLSRLACFHHDGTACAIYPTVTSACSMVTHPAIGDIDLDGRNEVVLSCVMPSGSPTSCRIRVFEHNGREKAGWPRDLNELCNGSPALGDADSDGDLDIFVAEGPGLIHGFRSDGSDVPGWPVQLDPIPTAWGYGQLHIADVDSDGQPELVTYPWSGNLYCYDMSGSACANWPIDYTLGEPCVGGGYALSVGDLDADSDLEIVLPISYAISEMGALRAFDGATGSVLWTTYFGSYVMGASPALGDIDGDGATEALTIGNVVDLFNPDHGSLSALNHDGTVVGGFPLSVSDGTYAMGGVTLIDLDNDGDVEIGAGAQLDYTTQYEGRIIFWDLPAPYHSDGMHWPLPLHDVQHTCNYHFPHAAPEVTPSMGAQGLLAMLVLSGLVLCSFARKLQSQGNRSNRCARDSHAACMVCDAFSVRR